MMCPHCNRTIHFNAANSAVYQSRDNERNGYSIDSGFCPACSMLIVLLQFGTYIVPDRMGDDPALDFINEQQILYPRQSARQPLPEEVPQNIRDDFSEAALVQPLSAKASAAISRRLLQHILRERWGIKRRTLQAEIQEFVKGPDIPSYVSETVDAVRVVGNLAAHPMKDENTGFIVDVEPEESEWLLEVIETLCDFSYVQPRRLETRKKALNAKLKSIGNPTI